MKIIKNGKVMVMETSKRYGSKSRVSILLAVFMVVILLFTLPVYGAGTFYTLTIVNGVTSDGGMTEYHGAEGEAFDITANPAPEGKAFDTWKTSGNVNISDLKAQTTSIIMMANDATIEATYKDNDPLTGIVSFFGNERFGEYLTATVMNTNNTGALSYLWTRDSGAGDITTGNVYYVDERFDEGNIITCTVTSSVQTGSIKASTGLISKNNPFKDMPTKTHWSREPLEAAVRNNLINGVKESDGTYINPVDYITRAQIATIVNRAFGAKIMAPLTGNQDVPASAWYSKEMQKAVKMGTMKLDSKMRPNDFITRQEAFTILGRALNMSQGSKLDIAGYRDASEVADWAVPAMGAMVKSGYIRGSNNQISPQANMTRAEFASSMYNLIQDYISTPGTVTKIETGNVMVNVPGVTLRNLVITGDLIVGDGVGDGTLTLDNVTVTGKKIIRSGEITVTP